MMKKFGVLMMCLLVSEAFASGGSGAQFGLSLLRTQGKVDGPALGDSESIDLWLDYKLGYTWDTWYLGGVFTTKEETTTTGSSSTTNKKSGYGVSFGYRNSGFLIDATYFLQGKYQMAGGTDLDEGSGMGLEFGHDWMMGSNLYLGVELSYQSWTFKKRGTIDEDNKMSETVPLVNIGFVF